MRGKREGLTGGLTSHGDGPESGGRRNLPAFPPGIMSASLNRRGLLEPDGGFMGLVNREERAAGCN